MTSIIEARFSIERKLVDLAIGGKSPLVDQIEAVLDGNAVLVFVHLCDTEANGGVPLCACVEWSSAEFDEAAFVEAFWRAGPASVARN